MAAKLTRLTHKIAMHLHLVAESGTICSSSSRRPVRKLFGYTSYLYITFSHLLGDQTSSGAHPASCSVGKVVSFPGDKVAEAWDWPVTSI